MSKVSLGSLQQKRILITGGYGFLGQSLVSELKKHGCTSIFLFRKSEFDLCRQGDVEKLFDTFRPEVVFHLAAVVGGIAENVRHPGTLYFENSLMSLLTIQEAKKWGVEKFITVGSICAYPNKMQVPLREETLWMGYPEPTNGPYGIAKRNTLVHLQSYRSEYNFKGIYLILASLYGPGDIFDLERSHVIPAVIRKCVEARRSNLRSLTFWGSGAPRREFLFVRDAAKSLIRAAEVYDSHEPLNIGSGVSTSIAELVNLIADLSDYRGEVHWDGTKPDGELQREFDLTRSIDALGEFPRTSLIEGLKETVEYFRDRHIGS